MSLPGRLEVPFRVRFDEAGADGRLSSSGFLRYAQEVAQRHAEDAGFGRAWTGERRLVWLIRAVELDILAPLDHASEIRVSTEVIGFRRVWGRRRSEFHRLADERILAVAVIDWVLLDAQANRPKRVPQEIHEAFARPLPTFTPARLDLGATPLDAHRHEFSVRPYDLDPLGHVNNARYVDYFEEALELAGETEQTRTHPRRYRLEYLSSAEPGDRLIGWTWEDDLGWAHRLTTEDGRELLRARLETDPAAWVGG